MVTISDHAVIRYLERRYGFSFEHVRAEMRSETLELADRVGCGTVIANGGKMVLVEGVVTTFLPKQARQVKRRLREREDG